MLRRAITRCENAGLAFAVGRFGFARIGSPIIRRNIVYVGQAQAAIAGLHDFNAVVIPQLFFDTGATAGGMTNGGCAAERSGIDGRLSGAGTEFVGAGFLVARIFAVATMDGAIVGTELFLLGLLGQIAKRQRERDAAGQVERWRQHIRWTIARTILFPS